MSLAMEEIAYGDAGIANMMAATNSPYNAAVLAYGTDAQKEKFLRPAASGRELAAFLLSEPQVGSDAANLADARGAAGDRYVIDGMKNFITSGQSAKLAMIFAVTDASAGKNGISCFLARTDSPAIASRGWRRSSATAPATPARSSWTGSRCRPRTCWARPARGSRSRCRRSTAGGSAWRRNPWASPAPPSMRRSPTPACA